jgi:hypothetical protein
VKKIKAANNASGVARVNILNAFKNEITRGSLPPPTCTGIGTLADISGWLAMHPSDAHEITRSQE